VFACAAPARLHWFIAAGTAAYIHLRQLHGLMASRYRVARHFLVHLKGWESRPASSAKLSMASTALCSPCPPYLGNGSQPYRYIIHLFRCVCQDIYGHLSTDIYDLGGFWSGGGARACGPFPHPGRGDRRREMDQRAMRVAQTRRHGSGNGTRI